MLAGIAMIVLAAAALAWLAGAAQDGTGADLDDRIDALLPQTQCGQCGFGGCRPYAAAIGAGLAGIDRCPPGGERTRRALAQLLGVDPVPGAVAGPGPVVARIDESACVGCAKCIAACPVDAIVGAPRRMHTVIESWCTGCGLCLPPCPTDCFSLVPAARRVELRLREHA
ncbi:MAG: RnfABCDGE type electron transport complex subunit B [Gammaproteobacteria bacterium]